MQIDDNQFQVCNQIVDSHCFNINEDGLIQSIRFNSKEFNYDKDLGSGSYGEIKSYKSGNENLVLKKFTGFDAKAKYFQEKIISILISKLQLKTDNQLPIIPSYWYEDSKKIIE